MAITVGTDANQTVAEVDAYHSARGNLDWASQGASEKEQNMRKAADYLERTFRWRGVKATSSQRLGWPRLDAYDDDGYKIGETDAPWQVKEAEAIIADIFRAGTFDLEGVQTNSTAAVVREKVDVIEVEYDTQARLKGPDVVTHVFQMLRGVTTGGTLLRA